MGTWSPEMKDSIVVKPITSRGDYNAPTYGIAQTVKCRYEADAVRTRSADGETIRWADFIITHTAVDDTDLVYGGWKEVNIWPPGVDSDDDELAHKPSRVVRVADLDGNDVLYEVTL